MKDYLPLLDFDFAARWAKLAGTPCLETKGEQLVDIIIHETQRIEHKDEPAASLVRRGYARWAMCLFDGAEKDFTAAIELDPDYASAYASRGALYTQRGKMDLAQKDQQKCQELTAKSSIETVNKTMQNVQAFYNIMMNSFFGPWIPKTEQSPPSSTEK